MSGDSLSQSHSNESSLPHISSDTLTESSGGLEEKTTGNLVMQRKTTRKRKKSNSPKSSATPCKQVQSVSPSAGSIKLQFTLSEEYMVSEIREAVRLMQKLFYDRYAHSYSQHDKHLIQKSLELYRQQSILRIPQHDQHYNKVCEDIYRSILVQHGNDMFESLRKRVPDGLTAVLAAENLPAVFFAILAQYFQLGRSGQAQAQLQFTESDAFIRTTLHSFPELATLPGLRRENFAEYCSPYLNSHWEEEQFEVTLDTLGDWLSSDGKLFYLCYPYLMACVAPTSKFAKNRNLKLLCTDIANLMFRYLSSREGYSDREAAMSVQRFIGLVPQIQQCGQRLLQRSLKLDSDDTSLDELLAN